MEAGLTFKRAVEIAVAIEKATKNALELQDGVKAENVNQLVAMREAAQMPTDQEKCYHCSGYHSSSQCWFRNEQCRKCGKIGQIKRVCRSDQAKNNTKANSRGNRNVHNVAKMPMDSKSESEDALANLQLCSIHGRDKQMI